MPHDPYKSLYLHIPYCKKRCNYCDFATDAVDRDSVIIDQYIEDLCLEIRRACSAGELGNLQTVYIGGGTPTHIGNSRLTSLLYMLSTSIKLENIHEFTLEANPDSLSEAIIKDSFAMGVNRLSIGVQSFDDNVLKILGRVHDADAARRAIVSAKDRFDNISIDLICGIPGQSVESFETSLDVALELGVPHISVYPLSVESNTPLHKMILHKEMDDVDQDVQAAHMELAAEILKEAGYEHYEISSFCKPGYESKHNFAYWSGLPYMGLGMSATTMTQNSQRRMRVTDGQIEDDLNPAQMAAEDCMLAMRTNRGISQELYSRANLLLPNLHTALNELISLELVAKIDDNYVPTQKGWMLGNEIYSRMLDLA